MHKLQLADYLVFFVYFIIIAGYGFYIYQKKNQNLPIPKSSFWQKVPLISTVLKFLPVWTSGAFPDFPF